MSDGESYSVVGSSTSATQESNLPQSSEILIIAFSAISAAILICFLAYVTHRMRQGHAFVDILKIRRAAPQADHHGYPIHFEQRYSVRSSRYPLSLLRGKSLPVLPGPVTRSGTQMTDNKPPSMVMEPHMAYLKGSDKKFNNRPSTRKSRNSNVPTISVTSIGAESTSPISSSHGNARWSWTNSEAPSTPRLNLEKKRTSTGSLAPHHKAVGYFDSHMDAIDEDSVPSVPSGKAQEILETGGIGYLPPRPLSKSKKATSWKSVFR